MSYRLSGLTTGDWISLVRLRHLKKLKGSEADGGGLLGSNGVFEVVNKVAKEYVAAYASGGPVSEPPIVRPEAPSRRTGVIE